MRQVCLLAGSALMLWGSTVLSFAVGWKFGWLGLRLRVWGVCCAMIHTSARIRCMACERLRLMGGLFLRHMHCCMLVLLYLPEKAGTLSSACCQRACIILLLIGPELRCKFVCWRQSALRVRRPLPSLLLAVTWLHAGGLSVQQANFVASGLQVGVNYCLHLCRVIHPMCNAGTSLSAAFDIVGVHGAQPVLMRLTPLISAGCHLQCIWLPSRLRSYCV